MKHNLNQPLNTDEIEKLSYFLLSEHGDADPMSITRAHGFLTAVISAPNLIMPSQWQPVLLGGYPEFESEEQAFSIIGMIDRFYNEINRKLKNNGDTFNPFLFKDGQIVPYEQATFDLAKEWCSGYLEGADLDEFWSEDEDGIELLFPFAVMADEFSLIGCPKEDGSIIQDDVPEKQKILDNLPKYIKDIHDQWMNIRIEDEKKKQQSFICSDEYDLPYKREIRKIGRNEPCPCGSGKKYKKCCFNQSLH